MPGTPGRHAARRAARMGGTPAWLWMAVGAILALLYGAWVLTLAPAPAHAAAARADVLVCVAGINYGVTPGIVWYAHCDGAGRAPVRRWHGMRARGVIECSERGVVARAVWVHGLERVVARCV